MDLEVVHSFDLFILDERLGLGGFSFFDFQGNKCHHALDDKLVRGYCQRRS